MIREARPGDETRLRTIQAQALDEPWPGLLEVAIDGAPEVLVVDDGEPIAYALVVPDHPVAYVAEFAVAPARQRQGHGSRLMAALLSRLGTAGFGTVRLTARADDDGVRAFYDRFGFAVADRLPDHYEDGDGVLLCRSL